MSLRVPLKQCSSGTWLLSLPMNRSAEHRLGVFLKPNHNWPGRCSAFHALACFMGSKREIPFGRILTRARQGGYNFVQREIGGGWQDGQVVQAI